MTLKLTYKLMEAKGVQNVDLKQLHIAKCLLPLDYYTWPFHNYHFLFMMRTFKNFLLKLSSLLTQYY